jgi:CrcB protein
MEFALNRCPFLPGQMMTPDKNFVAESCRRQDSWKKWRKRNPARARFGSGILHAYEGVPRYIMMKFLMVGIGGGIGSVLRFWVSSYLGERMGARFPYGTFAVNVTGSFLIGLVVTLVTNKADGDPHWRYLLPIGFIGGYTTFSAFEYETFRSMQDGKVLVASLNVVLSVTLGLAAVWLGVMAGRSLE